MRQESSQWFLLLLCVATVSGLPRQLHQVGVYSAYAHQATASTFAEFSKELTTISGGLNTSPPSAAKDIPYT